MATKTLGAESAQVTPPPFDPADWLTRFRAVGGCWMVGADEKVSIGWRLDQYTAEEHSNDQPFPARVIYRELEGDPGKREALKAHLLNATREAVDAQA